MDVLEKLAGVSRRLAAVAFADVAGWSREIEHNDVATLAKWKRLRAGTIEPRVREHGGRILEVQGDAVLIEFGSAVSAVTWALETQQAIASAASDDDDSPLSLRIGINVEDVIVDEGKLIGDGVNVAARIHQLASPGMVVVTRAVHDYVWNKVPAAFQFLGERRLKNIGRPVRVYQVEALAVGMSSRSRVQPHLAWNNRPAIAVLPFKNSGGSPEEQYFGDGITEDIISRLVRIHALYVIARNSTLRYRDHTVATRDIAAELGVRYLLDGTVRRQGTQLRITADLVDAVMEHTVWADRFDGAVDDIFAFQDRIASSIAGALEPKLYQREASRVLEKPTESLDAYDCVLRSLSLLYTFVDKDFNDAGEYLRRALALDPRYAQAHAYLAWWLNLAAGEGRSFDPTVDRAAAVSAATSAVELDPDDAICLAVGGHVRAFLQKDLDGAIELFERALAANENSAFAWGISASTYCFIGRPDDALERLRNAWRLSPYDPLNFWFLTVAGLSHFIDGRYDQAVGWLRKGKRANARFLACHRTLTASLAMSGDVQAAKRAANELLSIDPSFRVSEFISWYPLRRQDDSERFAKGLRLAGLPD